MRPHVGVRLGALGAVVAALAGCTSAAHAQGVSLRPLKGEIGVDADGRFGSQTWEEYRYGTFRQWLDVRLDGAVVHPRLFRFGADLRPMLWQGVASRTTDGNARDATSLLNYRLDGTLMGGRPLSVSAAAARSAGTDLRLFSVPREYDLAFRNVRADLRAVPLDAALEFLEDARVESRLSGETALPQVDLFRRSVLLTARNSKLRARGERVWQEDHLNGATFDEWRGDLTHRLRWGKGSSVSNTLRYLDRTGFAGRQQFTWQAGVRLQHARTAWSDLEYGQGSTDEATRSSSGRHVRATFTARPVQAFRVALSGGGDWQRYPLAARDRYRVRPAADLRIRLPSHAWARVHAAAGYQWLDQTNANGTGIRSDERHIVDATLRFRLVEQYPDPATVLVTSADGALVYQLDFDYRAVATADRLDIIVLPQGRIAVGDTVSVDYQFRLLPTGRDQAFEPSYGAEVGIQGFRLYVQRDQLTPRGDSAMPLLVGRDQVASGVELREQVGMVSIDLGGELRWWTYDGREGRSYNLRLGAGGRLREGLRATVSGMASGQRNGAEPYRNLMADGSLDWTPGRVFRFRGRLATWWWQQVGLGRQLFLGGSLEGEARLGLTRLLVRYDRSRWENRSVRAEHRVVAYLSRRF